MRLKLLGLSVLSFIFYLLLALAIFHFFHDEDISHAFEHGLSVTGQILTGTAAGSLAALLIMFIANRQPVSGVLDDFYLYKEISQMRFDPFDRVQLSLFAGAGEELLFRGAIQPLLGVWFTSVIFIAIHGYISFKSAGHILFVAMMLGLSVLMGYLFIYAGMIAAMSAHAVYDMVMLNWVRGKNDEQGFDQYLG